jgi:hypothetical protein
MVRALACGDRLDPGRTALAYGSREHGIKAADRLLGNPGIQRALPRLYAVLAALLLRRIRRLIILIDWTGGGSSAFYILCASLCFRGRALPLWSRTFPVKRKCSPKAEHEFLMDLVGLVARHCCPILVSDAGFHREWFGCCAPRWMGCGDLSAPARSSVGLGPDPGHGWLCQ